MIGEPLLLWHHTLKNALYLSWHAKTHFPGWGNVEQWEHQAHSSIDYQTTVVWTRQLVIYLESYVKFCTDKMKVIGG